VSSFGQVWLLFAMRLSRILLPVMLAACEPDADEGAAIDRVTPSTASADSASREIPLWVFGEGSDRTDALPADLDSLRSWGDYADGVSPVAYAVDLNDDDRPEWLVRAAPTLCGKAGCPLKLITRKADGTLVDLLDGLAQAIYVTNRRVNGWPVIWVYTGTLHGGLFRMELSGEGYEMTDTLRLWIDNVEWTYEQVQRDTLRQLLEGAEHR